MITKEYGAQFKRNVKYRDGDLIYYRCVRLSNAGEKYAVEILTQGTTLEDGARGYIARDLIIMRHKLTTRLKELNGDSTK